MPGTPLADDALSAAFSSMQLESVASGAFDAGGAWAIEFPGASGFKLHLVTKGEAWLIVGRKRVRLAAGDCALVPDGRTAIMSGEGSPSPMSLATVKRDAQNGVARLGRGGECFHIGVHFAFAGPLPGILFAGLPPVIVVDANGTPLRAHVDQFRAEYVQRGIGRAFLLHHLAPIILLQIVRRYLAVIAPDRTWLGALSDDQLARACDVIHVRYRERLTVAQLAKVAGMSRSGFALRFKRATGIAPMDYLASWRIQRACTLLRDTEETVPAIAAAVGYASPSSFSSAFARVMRCRPGAYRQR